jgi:hypothetical protein
VTLLNDYMRQAERIGVKRRSDETQFAFAMKRLLPDLRAAVKRRCEIDVMGEDGKWTKEVRRVRCWELGSLEQARDAFEAAVCQTIEWPAEEDLAHEDEDVTI